MHDIAKLLFTFVAFWAYMAFSQYMLIWYANLPEETVFFAHRSVDSWGLATAGLALGHFVVPFFFLLPRTSSGALRLSRWRRSGCWPCTCLIYTGW